MKWEYAPDGSVLVENGFEIGPDGTLFLTEEWFEDAGGGPLDLEDPIYEALGMTDTTFTLSYVVTDAILEAYIGSNPRTAAVALKAAAAATQEWYCQEATRAIDRIEFAGFKQASTQTRQFPRKYRPSEYDSPWGAVITEDAYGYVYDSTSVPQEVIDACCEEAIAIYEFLSDTDNIDRENMKNQGVENYNLGGVYSETIKRSLADRNSGLRSPNAISLLQKFIGKFNGII